MAQLKDNPKKEWLDLNHRLPWNDVPYDNSSMACQRVRDKIGFSKGWNVLTSVYDDKAKQFVFAVMINAQESETKVMSNEDVCNFLGWKSFKYDAKTEMITPKRITSAGF